VVRVNNLTFSYGGEPIFSEIGFSIYKGDFTVIIGSNGAGKSTLFRLILGELLPSGGEIQLFEGAGGKLKERPVIGYLPQNLSSINSDFPATVEEIVTANLFLRIGLLRFPKREHREKARESLASVGMSGFAGARFGDLSGGQRQRAMLARALVGDPALLMLDEPTSGVDAPSVRSMLDLLSAMNREQGVTVIMITHNIAQMLDYASRVLCLENGSLVELEKTQVIEELSHKHRHPGQQMYF
jgi:zinc transport system ATP-binding protein